MATIVLGAVGTAIGGGFGGSFVVILHGLSLSGFSRSGRPLTDIQT